jgi:putative endonuclease
MYPPKIHAYSVYILTNIDRTVLYIGLTNSLTRRLREHEIKTNTQSFTAKYNCDRLVFYEVYQYIYTAIAREKEIKKWSRAKKDVLIAAFNPTHKFLNDEFLIEED